VRDLLIKAGLGLAAAAYARDAVQRPQQVARLARGVADRNGKPLANLGAGVKGKSLRASVLGERLWGDVNLDAEAPLVAHGPDVVSFCNYYAMQWPDKHFGALFACDVLEGLEYPELALREWYRVAERVFVVVPSRWRPDKWSSRWLIDPSMQKAWPLWAQRDHIVLLPVSDTRSYSPARCQTPKPSPPPPPLPRTPSDPLPPSDGTESLQSVSTLTVLSGSPDEST